MKRKIKVIYAPTKDKKNEKNKRLIAVGKNF